MIFHTNLGGKVYQIEIEKQQGEYLVNIGGNSYRVDSRQISKGKLSLNIEGKIYDLMIRGNARNHQVDIGPYCYDIELWTSRDDGEILESTKGDKTGKIVITTPMPGKVIKVLKELNEPVKEGEGVIVVEAMKMENELKSPREGVISEIKVSPGRAVESGEILIVIE